MCGIAGLVLSNGHPEPVAAVRSMCAALTHRGPDDEGYYASGPVALGMRRLSIIDIDTGRQPVRNEDGSIQVVFNGEIYNYRDLRRDLERHGHSFYTSSDTETIVHLYEEHGIACVKKLRGMFAFAIWDADRQQLLLARDRLGIKPLFYANAGGTFAFASELKALLQIPELDRSLNWDAVDHLFTFMSTPGTQSIIEGVHKLEPGHLLTYRPGGRPQLLRYWDVHFEPDYARSEADFVEELRALLEESVRLRLMSEVPLGAFLSGGIDSSAVVATMVRLTSAPVKTFSIGFPEFAYNEAPYARRVAAEFETEHHELILEPDALDIVEELAWFLDEPFGDSSAIPTYMVSKLASAYVTVVLTGDGGDELFAGYDRYVVEAHERRYRHIPRPIRNALGAVGERMREGMKGRNFLRHLALDGPARYLDAATLFRPDAKRRLFQAEVFELLAGHDPRLEPMAFLDRENLAHPGEQNGNWLTPLQYLDLKTYLPLDILTKVDRMSMAHSLEARVPLLDHKLVEFAAAIPPQLRLRDGTTKHIFKQAMRGILPDATIDRRKQGFAIPLSRWFRGDLTSFLRDLLLSETSRRRGILDTAYIERLLAMHDGGRNLDLQLWTLASFELWCRTFLDRRTRAPVAHREARGPRAPVAARI